MKVILESITPIVFLVIFGCGSISSESGPPSDLVTGKWLIVPAISRDARGDVEPEMHTIQFEKNGTFRCWCKISDEDEKSVGEYRVLHSSKDNTMVIDIRMKSTRLHPKRFKLSVVKRGDVTSIDGQGKEKVLRDILAFTDHNGRKRGYRHE